MVSDAKYKSKQGSKYWLLNKCFELSKYSSRWRCPQDVFRLRLLKMFSRRLDQDEHIGLTRTSSRRLDQDHYLHDVFKTYHQVILFLLTCFQDSFKTSSQRFCTAKTIIYTEGFASVTLLRNYGQCTKFARVTTVSQVLAFRFTAPFSGCLQRRI